MCALWSLTPLNAFTRYVVCVVASTPTCGSPAAAVRGHAVGHITVNETDCVSLLQNAPTAAGALIKVARDSMLLV